MIDSNHGWKIARWLDGKKVTLNHGDEKVEQEFNKLEELYGEEVTDAWKKKVKKLLLQAPSHYIIFVMGLILMMTGSKIITSKPNWNM